MKITEAIYRYDFGLGNIGLCAIFVYVIPILFRCVTIFEYVLLEQKIMFRYTGGERFSVCFWNSEEGSKSVDRIKILNPCCAIYKDKEMHFFHQGHESN